MARTSKALAKREKLNVTRLGDISFRGLMWDAGKKFHKQTRLISRFDNASWYVVAEGIHLSQKNKRWKDEAESFEAYWEQRGITPERLQSYLARYEWLQNFDDADRSGDPPSWHVMSFILRHDELFANDKRLRRLALQEGYSASRLEEVIRANEGSDAVKKNKPRDTAYNPESKSVARIEHQLDQLGSSLDENVSSLTTGEKGRVMTDLEKVLLLLDNPDVGADYAPSLKPSYVALKPYLEKPAKVIAKATGVTKRKVQTGLVDALTELSSYKLNKVLSVRGRSVLYDQNRQDYLDRLVVEVAKQKFNVNITVNKGVYKLNGVK